ncbi:MAG: YetF domain-containing protein [Chitinophagales bacterium]
MLTDAINSATHPNYLIVIGATTAVYLFLVLAIIIFGKREIGQLSITDLVFLLLISNAVQNAMVDGDWDSLWVGIVAAITLFALNLLFKNLVYKSSQFNKLIEGEPVLLIYHGKMVIENIRKEQITLNELEGAIRENGFENITEVSLAKLETNGNISVVGFKDEKSIVFRKKKRHVPPRMRN